MCEQIHVRNGGAGMCQVQTEIQEGNSWLYQVCWERHHRGDSVGQKGRGNLGWGAGERVHSRQREQLEQQGQQLGAGGGMWTWQL